MDGAAILAQTLTVPALTRTSSPTPWQYHSRGGRHSITACWGVMLDLLANSSLLRQHVAGGKVVFGLDHKMHDYAANRSKNLDLVIARPHDAGWTSKRPPRRFSELPVLYDMHLTPEQRSTLEALPDPVQGAVGAVHLALEAKACMTAFSKSYPRLYDELNSSPRSSTAPRTAPLQSVSRSSTSPTSSCHPWADGTSTTSRGALGDCEGRAATSAIGRRGRRL